MNTADLQFNIIYTPRTVRQLSPFVHSLLRWTNCRYRLVANACEPAERAQLQDLARSDPRLDYLLAAESEMLDHGSVLDWLQEQTDDEWLCFMDSDILATGSYMAELGRHLDECDVFTAGHPLWYAPEDVILPTRFRRWQGSYHASADGRQLGFTYFAVYRNELLSQVRARTGVGFRYRYWDDIDPAHRKMLRQRGLDKLDYDTGKLLMALMLAEGARLRTAELQHLCHLGGVSARADDEPAFWYRGRFDRLACRLFGGRLAGPLLYLADLWYGLRRVSPGLTPAQNRTLPIAERRVMQSRMRKRINTARYFNALFASLQDRTPAPALPVLGFRPAERRIARATRQVAALFARLDDRSAPLPPA